jgi:hypothetical protein
MDGKPAFGSPSSDSIPERTSIPDGRVMRLEMKTLAGGE